MTPADHDRLAAEHARLASAAALAVDMTAESFTIHLDQQARLITNWMTHQGFWESDNFGEKVALIHSELSEMLEANRKTLPSDHIPGFSGEEEKAADVLIRLLDMAGQRGWRLGEAYAAKMKMNFTRPFKHGKAY